MRQMTVQLGIFHQADTLSLVQAAYRSGLTMVEHEQ